MSEFLRALHEAGHAVVGKAVGHEVYHIHLDENPVGSDYCDGGYMGSAPKDRRLRAIVALGGYFAQTMFGQGRGFEVNDWDTAEQDWSRFQEYRDGMTYRHARAKVQAILRARSEELLALTDRVVAERDVYLDPHPSEYAIEAVAL